MSLHQITLPLTTEQKEKIKLLSLQHVAIKKFSEEELNSLIAKSLSPFLDNILLIIDEIATQQETNHHPHL